MCDETHSWINEKDQALSTEDFGRDLASVQALQRRHQVCMQYLLRVCVHVCVFVCVCVCVHLCVHVCIYSIGMGVRACVCGAYV